MYSQYGINCFLPILSNNTKRFEGRIKVEATDFQVNEIGLDGIVAGRDGTYDVPMLPSKRRKLNDNTEEKTSSSVVKPLDSEIPWSEIKMDPEKQLLSMIGESLFTSLSNLASSCNTDLQTIDLGCFNQKKDRSILHQCIRYIFPNIMSNPFKDADNTNISCKIDPAFVELTDIGIAEEVVKNFFIFINCRLLKCCMDSKEKYILDVSKLERDSRSRLHNFLQKKYGAFLESKTFFDGTYSISIRFKERKEPVKRYKRKIRDIYRVVLRRENMELLHVLDLLAKELKVHLSTIKFAGVKDKKALTHQFITLSGVKESDLKIACDSKQNGWSISWPPQSVPEELQLGNLTGNMFQINVRDVKCDQEIGDLKEELASSIATIENNGFINYFGEQRFGINSSSPMIGKHLLLNNFIEAVNIVFKPLENTDNFNTPNPAELAKLEFTSTKDIKKTMKLMPSYKVRECLILKALNRYSFTEDGCIQGFRNLPYASRLFYVHSYCSYVWNRVVSRRIERFGFVALAGDLVYNKEDSLIIVSEHDMNDYSYTLKDVILPLPGTSVQLPENETRTIYEDILKEDGLSFTDFKLRKLNMNNIPGAYRNVVTIPQNVQWQLNNTNQLKLNFVLQSSSYATMFLRELLRADSILF